MQVYYIYKLTNTVNGKGYIGFTSKEPEERWKAHLENLKKAAKKHLYLYNAINKYGWDKFTKEVLYCSTDLEHTLKIMEPYFIEQHNTHFLNEQGYNLTLGGDGVVGHKHSQEFKDARSMNSKGVKNPFFGRHHSEEAKAAVGAAVKRTRHLRIGEAAPFAGHKHSTESRKQIGDTQAGTWLITFPDGHQETIQNLRAFARENGLTAPLMIAVSKGLQRHHKQFRCSKVVCAAV